MFRHASASLLRDVYCLKRSEDLMKKIVPPVLFDTTHSFKRISALSLTKLLFIKVSMVHCSRLVFFASRKSSVFPHASASLLRDVYCLKRFEDLIEKNYISGYI